MVKNPESENKRLISGCATTWISQGQKLLRLSGQCPKRTGSVANPKHRRVGFTHVGKNLKSYGVFLCLRRLCKGQRPSNQAIDCQSRNPCTIPAAAKFNSWLATEYAVQLSSFNERPQAVMIMVIICSTS